MLSLSLPGLIGAAMGLALGLLNFGVVVSFVETRLRALDRSTNAAEKADFERRITLMRRTMLVLDIVAFSAVGYLFGQTIAGGLS
ncbi:hypothetical protein [Blastochloris sulfoviridis]|uniref:Uncharacterized protein n=1 Tax=Blastochloris sulfoviridis TaxID=50712 RepID=A0A5M6HYY9_9HYPH|nr:hypothetical protein [Blastochloris sulfoviridis]KAA5601132.1 hypothetical protein F1193_10005 [Blastochloris sulfoviridis]